MSRSKEQVAEELRRLADRAEDGRAVADALRATALALESEHRQETIREEIRNQGTEECPMCHGWGVYVGTREREQCPRCMGWGRMKPA